METLTAGRQEAGQRLDKLLGKYLDRAPKSFIYKMLRKKNITLNGKKCDGSERLSEGDRVTLFLSAETIGKFSSRGGGGSPERPDGREKLPDRAVIYEDSQILLINKPAGMLSQKAKEGDVSLAELVTAHLLDNGSITEEQLRTFRPSVCNRLDRNTSGLVAAGKSLAALQILGEMFRSRDIHKEYLCAVKGRVSGRQVLEGYLTKDEASNRVTVFDHPVPDGSAIRTEYEPVAADESGRCTLLLVTLITGRTHQIRAHLAFAGHPVLGDPKYGDRKINREMKSRFGIGRQMLHSYRIRFPELREPLAYLGGRAFTAPPPEEFARLFAGRGTI